MHNIIMDFEHCFVRKSWVLLRWICPINGLYKILFSMEFHKIRVNSNWRKKTKRLHIWFVSGAWLKNPYIAFGISALVEIAAYAVVQLVLDRWGRRKTYCLFVISLSFVALLIIPIQMLLPKDSICILIIRS